MSDLSKLEYTELCRQPYGDCVISAGMVEGHEIDNFYLELCREGETPTRVIMTADELAAIGWVAIGAVWSQLIAQRKGLPWPPVAENDSPDVEVIVPCSS